MAKKIFKAVGGALGLNKKKKAAPVEETGPKITQLNPTAPDPKRPLRRPALAPRDATILADKLGG